MINEQATWKKRLEKIGVSQRDFAEMINDDETVMSLYLNCKREPRINKFFNICETIKKLEADYEALSQ